MVCRDFCSRFLNLTHDSHHVWTKTNHLILFSWSSYFSGGVIFNLAAFLLLPNPNSHLDPMGGRRVGCNGGCFGLSLEQRSKTMNMGWCMKNSLWITKISPLVNFGWGWFFRELSWSAPCVDALPTEKLWDFPWSMNSAFPFDQTWFVSILPYGPSTGESDPLAAAHFGLIFIHHPTIIASGSQNGRRLKNPYCIG